MGRAAIWRIGPAKVAEENQHKNDNDDDPENRHVILSLGAWRLYSPSAHPLLFAGGLGESDERNAKSENESGDSEPYRSPKTKLRGARRRFTTTSPNEEKPLGAALNSPFLWCPNDTKCWPRPSARPQAMRSAPPTTTPPN